MKRSAVKSLRFAALAAGALSVMTATAALPSGYLEFEYIQGNGSNARIVLDDYTPTPPNANYIAVDPKGPATGSNKLFRSCYGRTAVEWVQIYLRSSYKSDPNAQNAFGYRVVCDAVAK